MKCDRRQRRARVSRACALSLGAIAVAAAVLGCVPNALSLGVGSAALADPGDETASAPEPAAREDEQSRSPASAWAELQVRRAGFEWRRGDVARSARLLQEIPVASLAAPPPGFADAERAIALLGFAYLRLDAIEEASALAESVLRERPASAAAAVIARLSLAASLRSPRLLRDPAGASDGVRRALGVEDEPAAGDALARYGAALAAESRGEDARDAWRTLAGSRAASPLDRDLTAAAALHLAALEGARAASPADSALDPQLVSLEAILAGVDPASAFAPRARLVLGSLLLDRGERARGRELLERNLGDSGDAASRRASARRLAGLALEEGRWADADSAFREVAATWASDGAAIGRAAAEFEADRSADPWRAFESSPGVIVFDEGAFHALAFEGETSATDLRSEFAAGELPAAAYAPSAGAARAEDALPPLGAEALVARARAADAWRIARRAHGEALGRLADAEVRAGRLADHFARARRAVDGSEAAIGGASDALGALAARADAALVRLGAICAALEANLVARAGEIDRRGERAAAIVTGLEYARDGQRAWDGGARVRVALELPDSVLREEARLASDERGTAVALGASTPGRLVASFDALWAPSLRSEIAALGGRASAAIASSAELRGAIDARLAAIDADAALVALRAEARACSVAAGNEASRAADVVRETARVALASATEELAREGEGIDYGRAVAASEFGFEVARTAADPARPEARSHARALDAEAKSLFREFLARYPESAARDDARFRLAERLAESPAPQERSEARAAYAALLDDAWSFPRRDAVLFNLGALLSDDGDPEASRHFESLVAEFPRSRYGQEAHLRLGDERFASSDLPAAAEAYARAAAGASRERSAIALYKLGWTRFREERFRDAAVAFRDLLDLYASEDAPALADLREEADEYLVTSLARAGGARVFAEIFMPPGARPGEERTLTRLAETLARFSQFAAACVADSIWLARYPESEGALDAAAHWVETLDLANRAADARRVRLALAERFAPAGAWCRANAADSLRAAAAKFGIAACEDVARHHHHEAAASGSAEAWREALRVDELLVATWPDAEEAPAARLNAAMAASSLGEYARALGHAEDAARAGAPAIAEEAAWRIVGIRDHWYESSRPRSRDASAAGPGDSTLASASIDAAESYAARRGGEARARDALWRAADLALIHAWNERAAALLETFLASGASDARAPLGARLRARALFDATRYAAAARAYQEALVLSQVEPDSVRSELARMIPLSEFLAIDAAQRAEAVDASESAAQFVAFARSWPAAPEADRALYQAGLLYDSESDAASAVAAWRELSERYPASEFSQDARLASAAALERAGDPRAAGAALASFALGDRDGADARAALRKASALFAAAHDSAAADSLDDVYLAAFPDDEAAAFEILGARARRELRLAGPSLAVSSILRGDSKGGGAPSALAEYLEFAAARPGGGDREILARTAYLVAEEAREACAAARLSQPIGASVGIKKALLTRALDDYRECAAFGAAPWDRAAAYRIGQMLVEFGDALEASERPAGLGAEAAAAYEAMIEKQSAEFYERGEKAWADLLERVAEEDGDEGEWIEETRCALEDRGVRLGDRAATSGGGRWGEGRANAR